MFDQSLDMVEKYFLEYTSEVAKLLPNLGESLNKFIQAMPELMYDYPELDRQIGELIQLLTCTLGTVKFSSLKWTVKEDDYPEILFKLLARCMLFVSETEFDLCAKEVFGQLKEKLMGDSKFLLRDIDEILEDRKDQFRALYELY